MKNSSVWTAVSMVFLAVQFSLAAPVVGSTLIFKAKEGEKITITYTRPTDSFGNQRTGKLRYKYRTLDQSNLGNPATGGSSAGSGVDYQHTSGTIELDTQDQSKTIDVQTYQDDVVDGRLVGSEVQERFKLELYEPSRYAFQYANGTWASQWARTYSYPQSVKLTGIIVDTN